MNIAEFRPKSWKKRKFRPIEVSVLNIVNWYLQILIFSASSSIAESSTAVASETPQLSSSSGVPVLPSISQPSSTAQVAPSSSEAQQVPSSSSVFVTSVLPLLTQAATATSSATQVAPSRSNIRQHSSSSSVSNAVLSTFTQALTFSSSAAVPNLGNSSPSPSPTRTSSAAPKSSSVAVGKFCARAWVSLQLCQQGFL